MRQREAISEARKRGERAGENAASWVFDGNTTPYTYEYVARGLADGDPAVYDTISEPEWLSGEWAGESITELLGDILPDDPDKAQEIEDVYCESANGAFWTTVENIALANASPR